MERQTDAAGPALPDENEQADQHQTERGGIQNKGPDRDIARIARSLGFSPEEIFEIERLYLSVPDGLLK